MSEEKKYARLLERELLSLLSRPSGRRAFLQAIPLLLASCASQKKTRYREGDNSGQETELTVSDEKKMTREYLPQMQKEYPPHPSSRAQERIKELGHRIVKANNLEGRPYHYNFTVVKSQTVNAFALPAGEVFVTAPLIKMVDSEAELAGVVGHEIGHIKARHTAERMDKAKKEEGKGWLYGLGGAILGGGAGLFLGKLLCSKQDRECLQRAALYGASAGGVGGLLIQKFAFMANSREDEMEADRIGFKTALNAGYSKDHVGLFYNKLLEMSKKYRKDQNSISAAFTDAMSTHPPSEERVAQMTTMSRDASSVGRATVSTLLIRDLKENL